MVERGLVALDGKKALVTGAASGLGRATALVLAGQGVSVACVDLDGEAASATAKEAASGGGTAIGVACDVSDAEAVDRMVAEVVSSLDGLDIVVNCAGILRVGPIASMTTDDFRRVLEVNLIGTYSVCRAAMPHLERSGGNIVNIASNAATTGVMYGTAYNASKGGVAMLTKSLSLECAPKGVRVNAVAPGGMETPMVSDFAFPEDTPMEMMMRIMSPLGMAPPESVANVVAFVASDAASNMTGAVVAADGGATA